MRRSADKDGLLLSPFHYSSRAELGSSDGKGWERERLESASPKFSSEGGINSKLV